MSLVSHSTLKGCWSLSASTDDCVASAHSGLTTTTAFGIELKFQNATLKIGQKVKSLISLAVLHVQISELLAGKTNRVSSSLPPGPVWRHRRNQISWSLSWGKSFATTAPQIETKFTIIWNGVSMTLLSEFKYSVHVYGNGFFWRILSTYPQSPLLPNNIKNCTTHQVWKGAITSELPRLTVPLYSRTWLSVRSGIEKSAPFAEFYGT